MNSKLANGSPDFKRLPYKKKGVQWSSLFERDDWQAARTSYIRRQACVRRRGSRPTLGCYPLKNSPASRAKAAAAPPRCRYTPTNPTSLASSAPMGFSVRECVSNLAHWHGRQSIAQRPHRSVRASQTLERLACGHRLFFFRLGVKKKGRDGCERGDLSSDAVRRAHAGARFDTRLAECFDTVHGTAT